jgi:hypothetical protein
MNICIDVLLTFVHALSRCGENRIKPLLNGRCSRPALDQRRKNERLKYVKSSDMRVCIQERVAFLRHLAALAARCPVKGIGKSWKRSEG